MAASQGRCPVSPQSSHLRNAAWWVLLYVEVFCRRSVQQANSVPRDQALGSISGASSTMYILHRYVAFWDKLKYRVERAIWIRRGTAEVLGETVAPIPSSHDILPSLVRPSCWISVLKCAGAWEGGGARVQLVTAWQSLYVGDEQCEVCACCQSPHNHLSLLASWLCIPSGTPFPLAWRQHTPGSDTCVWCILVFFFSRAAWSESSPVRGHCTYFKVSPSRRALGLLQPERRHSNQ
jgi:hypothetical protein